jgi:cell division protein FtsW (lipid II flippase)
MAIDRRLLFNIDWGFLGAALILMGIGVATILSATFAGRNTGLEVKQLYAIALGLVGMLVVVSLDYRRLVDRARAVPGRGGRARVRPRLRTAHRGARCSWAGRIPGQPSEFAKLVAALLVASSSRSEEGDARLFDLLVPGAAVGLMVVLIAAEPDLGTAFTLVPLS